MPGFDLSQITMDLPAGPSRSPPARSRTARATGPRSPDRRRPAHRLPDKGQDRQGDTDRITTGWGSIRVPLGDHPVGPQRRPPAVKLADQLRALARTCSQGGRRRLLHLDGHGGVRADRTFAFPELARVAYLRSPAFGTSAPRPDRDGQLRASARRHVLQRRPRLSSRSARHPAKRRDPALRVRGGLRRRPPAGRGGQAAAKHRPEASPGPVRAVTYDELGQPLAPRSFMGTRSTAAEIGRAHPVPRDAVRVHRRRRQGEGAARRHDRCPGRRPQRGERRPAAPASSWTPRSRAAVFAALELPR
ncbi:hypothetical protein HBB16_17730 [Pseudonocardia sp. MCCB 268]|nr:hypothetical protein [Pseudonocardia cytotoxica]